MVRTTIRKIWEESCRWASRSDRATRDAEIQLARELKQWGDMLMDHARGMPRDSAHRRELKKRSRGYYQKAAHIGRRHGLAEFMGAGY